MCTEHESKKSQTAAKNTDMKPNFRPLSFLPAGLQRQKKHCPRKALLSFQWWVKTRLFLIDTTCRGVFCGWIPTAVPPASPSPPNALHQLIFQRQHGGESSFLLSDRPPSRTHRLYKLQARIGSRVVVRFLGGHSLIRPPRSGEVWGRRESSAGRRRGVTHGVHAWSREVSEGTVEQCQNREVQTRVRAILSNIKSWENIKVLQVTLYLDTVISVHPFARPWPVQSQYKGCVCWWYVCCFPDWFA